VSNFNDQQQSEKKKNEKNARRHLVAMAGSKKKTGKEYVRGRPATGKECSPSVYSRMDSQDRIRPL